MEIISEIAANPVGAAIGAVIFGNIAGFMVMIPFSMWYTSR